MPTLCWLARKRKESWVGVTVGRHVDSRQAREIEALKTSGMAPKEIAVRINVSVWSVYRFIRKNVSGETETPNVKQKACPVCNSPYRI